MTKFALVVIETGASRSAARSDRTAHRRSIQEWLEVQAVAGTVVGVEMFETEDVGPVTVRRVDPDLVVVLQGPFAGSEETLGGVVLVDVPARDDAVDLAKSWPTGETIEVRPVLTVVAGQAASAPTGLNGADGSLVCGACASALAPTATAVRERLAEGR
jgi:hypothetical protein